MGLDEIGRYDRPRGARRAKGLEMAKAVLPLSLRRRRGGCLAGQFTDHLHDGSAAVGRSL